MGFPWSLSYSKSYQVSRTLLSILAVLNNVVVWMVSSRPPTSKSSIPFSNPLVTVPNAPIAISIIVMFHSFFNSLARSRYLSFFSHSFSFILWSAGSAKSTILQVLFFCWLLIGLDLWPRLADPCVCQSSIGVYVCYFLGQVLDCAYTICSYYYFNPLLLFHTCVCWWSFTVVWAIASFFKSPRVFFEFWPISIMQFGWSLLVHRIPLLLLLLLHYSKRVFLH